jgi:hypothetical protein
MPDNDRTAAGASRDPPVERMQVDPLLRENRISWGWGLAISAVFFIVAVMLFATNRDADQVTVTPPAAPPRTTTGAGPMPPLTQPGGRTTTGQGQ